MKEASQPMQLRLSNLSGQQSSGLINPGILNTSVNSSAHSLNKSQISVSLN